MLVTQAGKGGVGGMGGTPKVLGSEHVLIILHVARCGQALLPCLSMYMQVKFDAAFLTRQTSSAMALHGVNCSMPDGCPVQTPPLAPLPSPMHTHTHLPPLHPNPPQISLTHHKCSCCTVTPAVHLKGVQCGETRCHVMLRMNATCIRPYWQGKPS